MPLRRSERYIGVVKSRAGRNHDVIFVAASDRPLSGIQARAFAAQGDALLPSKAEAALLVAMSEIYMDRWYWASSGSRLMFCLTESGLYFKTAGPLDTARVIAIRREFI